MSRFFATSSGPRKHLELVLARQRLRPNARQISITVRRLIPCRLPAQQCQNGLCKSKCDLG